MLVDMARPAFAIKLRIACAIHPRYIRCVGSHAAVRCGVNVYRHAASYLFNSRGLDSRCLRPLLLNSMRFDSIQDLIYLSISISICHSAAMPSATGAPSHCVPPLPRVAARVPNHPTLCETRLTCTASRASFYSASFCHWSCMQTQCPCLCVPGACV
jgi:hypothetical protein